MHTKCLKALVGIQHKSLILIHLYALKLYSRMYTLIYLHRAFCVLKYAETDCKMHNTQQRTAFLATETAFTTITTKNRSVWSLRH